MLDIHTAPAFCLVALPRRRSISAFPDHNWAAFRTEGARRINAMKSLFLAHTPIESRCAIRKRTRRFCVRNSDEQV
jgi:hypothetical protein